MLFSNPLNSSKSKNITQAFLNKVKCHKFKLPAEEIIELKLPLPSDHEVALPNYHVFQEKVKYLKSKVLNNISFFFDGADDENSTLNGQNFTKSNQNKNCEQFESIGSQEDFENLQNEMNVIPKDLLKMRCSDENELIVEISVSKWYLVLQMLTTDAIDEVDIHGNSVLHTAVELQHLPTIQMLIHRGFSISLQNNHGQSPYKLAAAKNTRVAHNLFTKMSANKKKNEKNLLARFHQACSDNDVCELKFMLCTTNTVNDTDSEFNTPLHTASNAGSLDVAHLLLDLGANVNAQNKTKGTALHRATQGDHLDVCVLLLASGASVNAVDEDRRTALHLACCYDRLDICKLLVNHEADLNLTANCGRTPLHVACLKGFHQVAEYLIR